ncbi:MAG: sodium ion-translocating decarboxylase subunit beta, partial [Bacteroidales bacterium]
MEFNDLMPAIAGMTWQNLVMIAVGLTLIFLAVKKQYEPTLLLPMGFGAILVN